MKAKKLMIICLALAVIVLICNVCGLFKNTTLEGIKDYILSFGALAPVIYIIMFALVPLTLFPDSILAVAGGTVFGLVWGTIYTIIGATIGGTISFYISRTFGRDAVERLVKHKAQWFEDGAEKQGFLLVFILRLIPLIPFDIISYGAGLSKIRYRDFVTATVLGIIPGVMVYTNIGDKVIDVYSWKFICSIAALLALCIISFYARKKLSIQSIQERFISQAKTEPEENMT